VSPVPDPPFEPAPPPLPSRGSNPSFASPPLTPSAPELYTGRHLDAIAARWGCKARSWDQELADPACHLNEDGAYDRFLLEIHRLIAEQAQFCSRQGVVDAGCGTGLVLAEVVAGFRWGVGIDLSAEMIQVAARKKIARTQFMVGDCFELSALCAGAGAVVSRGVLLSHYGGELGKGLLRAAYAALVPGGFLAFDFLNESARALYRHVPGNKTFYTRAQAVRLAEDAGVAAPRVVGEDQRRTLLLVGRRAG
jgi:SAM-dependent methyltransferase